MKQPDIYLASKKIAEFEEFRSEPYKDMVGRPTIGYGTTLYPTGLHVELSDRPCSKDEALGWMTHWIQQTSDELWPHFSIQPTLNEYSAILSLAYNVGSMAVIHSTLLNLFNQGRLLLASEQFTLWDHATIDGRLVEVEGLKKRRLLELKLFNTP